MKLVAKNSKEPITSTSNMSSPSQFQSTVRRLAESKADEVRALILAGGKNKNEIAKITGSNYTQVHEIHKKMVAAGTVPANHLPMGKTASAILSGTASTPPVRPNAPSASSTEGEGKSARARRMWLTTNKSVGQIAKELGMHYSHAWQTLKKIPRGEIQQDAGDDVEMTPPQSTSPSASRDAAVDAEFDDIQTPGSQTGLSVTNPAARYGGSSSGDSRIPLGNGPSAPPAPRQRELGYTPDAPEAPLDKDPMVAATTGRNSVLADKIADRTLELVSVVDNTSFSDILTGILDSPGIRSLADTMSSADLETLIRSVINRLVKGGDLALNGGVLSIPDFNDDSDGPSPEDLAGEEDYDQDISDLLKKAEAGGSAYEDPEDDNFDPDEDDYGTPKGRRGDDDWVSDWASQARSGGRRRGDEDDY